MWVVALSEALQRSYTPCRRPVICNQLSEFHEFWLKNAPCGEAVAKTGSWDMLGTSACLPPLFPPLPLPLCPSISISLSLSLSLSLCLPVIVSLSVCVGLCRSVSVSASPCLCLSLSEPLPLLNMAAHFACTWFADSLICKGPGYNVDIDSVELGAHAIIPTPRSDWNPSSALSSQFRDSAASFAFFCHSLSWFLFAYNSYALSLSRSLAMADACLNDIRVQQMLPASEARRICRNSGKFKHALNRKP